MRRFVFRWLVRPLLVITLPLALIVAGAWFWLSTSLPETMGTISLQGLTDPVEIVRDSHGIPHIFAKNDADAAFALGFVHAQDRLWQMEQLRRLASGHLAELVGEGALPLDRFARTVGLEHLAESALASLAPEIRADLDAYAAGVNAFIGHHHGAWPPEYMVLGAAPAPWRPVDSLVWGELMAVQLSGHWRTELLRAQLLKKLTPDQVEQLWPHYPDDSPATLALESGLERDLPIARLAAITAPFDGQGASNAWAVSGTHTLTGKPALANDPHLGFSLPILWYLARIETPTLHLVGATVPGVPIVILGHNDRIAWGMTTTGGDLEDLFVEKIDPNDPDRYLTPDGSLPFRTRTEIIGVRGEPAVTLTVRETRHGPVISDVVKDAAAAGENGTAIALAATWLNPDNRIAQAIYGIDRAHDWGSFTESLKDFGSPQQNIIYADVDGHIGFYTAGAMPVRKAGDGRLPVPGWSGDYDWTGMLPFDELPHGLDPASSRFVNANNKVIAPDYPHHVTTQGWDEPYRAVRIESLLNETPQAGLDSFAKIQGDIVSLAARELLPLVSDIDADTPELKAVLERMKRWDGVMDSTKPEPLIFAAWMRELERSLFAEKMGDAFPGFWGQNPKLIQSIFTTHPEWCAKPGAPVQAGDCRVRSAEALKRALAWLAEHYGRDFDLWRWGDAHRTQFVHRIFDRIPVVSRFVNLRLAADGGNYTLNRAGYRVADEQQPFADVHGAGYRALYDLADLSRSRFVIATGQSGNPLSSHFTDFTTLWRDVDYVTIAGSRDEVVGNGGQLLTLVPR
jgi:penicillin G amidase